MKNLNWIVPYYLSRAFSTASFDRGIFVLFLLYKDFDTAQIGILQIIFYVGNILISIPMGLLADRFGYRKVMLLALFMMSLDAVLQIMLGGFMIFAVIFALKGAMFAIMVSVPQSFFFAKLKSLNQTHLHIKLLGQVRAIEYISLAVAIFIGGFLQSISWEAVYLSYAVFMVLGAICLGLVSDIKKEENIAQEITSEMSILKNAQQFKTFLCEKSNTPLAILAFAFACLQGVITPYFVFAQELFNWYGMSVAGIGTLFAIITATSGVAVVVAHRITHLFSFSTVSYVTVILLWVVLLLNIVPSLSLAICLFIMAMVIPEIAIILFADYIQHSLPNEIRATVTSVIWMLEITLTSLGYALFGGLFLLVTPNIAIALFSFIALLVLLLMYMVFTKFKISKFQVVETT